MKNGLLRGVAAVAMLSAAGAAFAADLPNRREVFAPAASPVIVPPTFTWSGFYVGVNAGYNFRDNSATTVGTPGFVALGAAVPGSLSVGRDGFIGGAQIGWNQQYGNVVAGVEADFQGLESQRRGSSFTSPALGGLTTAATSRMDYFGTVRARLGYVPMDRLMIYVTGGLAYGNPRNDAAVGAAGTGALWAGSSDATRFGWTVGGGLEYALTNQWTAKLEYLYYDLGRRTVTANPINAAAAATGVAYQARFENTGQIVRAGVNYKF